MLCRHSKYFFINCAADGFLVTVSTSIDADCFFDVFDCFIDPSHIAAFKYFANHMLMKMVHMIKICRFDHFNWC